jgi:hypothetical protein
MKTAKRNWKTTITGMLMLALAGVGIWQDPVRASDPTVIAAIAGGVGLIAAKDGDKTSPEQPATQAGNN